MHQFAPPAVLVNAELAILQFRGPTGAFLEPPVGKASFNVLKMARVGLMLPLRAAINQARKESKPARKDNVRVQHNGSTHTVNLEVIPLKNLRERCFLILFQDAESASAGRRPRSTAAVGPARAIHSTRGEKQQRVAQLETELSETREYLQSLQEQHEAANEELQAANEEVQSANEELQSINEELETSKEELESANEELTTVNEEMAHRNLELNRLNNDQVNIQTSAKLAIVVLGRDGAIRRFSPQAEKQLNLVAADVGRPIRHLRHDLVLGDDARSPFDLDSVAAEVVSTVREHEHEVLDRDGRWYSLRVRPYITLDNKVDGSVLVLVDITTIKRAQDAQASLAAIVSSSEDAIVSTDLRGVIQTWNQGAQHLYGYTAEEAIGQPTTLLIPPDRIDEYPGILEQVRRGETIDHYETVRRRKDGNLLDISLTISPIRDAGARIIGGAKIARDVTERKRIERELAHYIAELSEADLRKNEFLAMLGHELRNPLSALAHGLALQGNVPEDHARSEELREMMVRQTQRMATLLDQLLDVARITSGKVELSNDRIDLSEVVRAAVETVRSLVEAEHHTLTLALPSEHVFVMGDAVRLAQVVENLLTNAVKYTDQAGQIRLAVEASQHEARISVSDTGIGMTAELLPHIFEVFTQGPRALDRAKGGLGLGLPLARRLVEMHGGHIDATSLGVGQGSEFIVTLPRLLERPSKELPRSANSDPGPTLPGAIRSRGILVVDDERESGELLAELLEQHGHRTLAVNSGQAALAAIPAFGPEVVLLDIGLPEMDGYEVARRLREEYPDMRMLLIAVTGYQSDAARLKQAGFDEYLIKPPDMRKLFAILAEPEAGAGSRQLPIGQRID
jgi:two-component system CheB/CheR fusion protein